MAADMHIHVLEGATEADIADFFSNTLGSKHFNLMETIGSGRDRFGEDSAYSRISKTPNIWVGEVSWLKAALFEDESFIPDVVGRIAEIIGEDLPTVDDDLLRKIGEAFNDANAHGYYSTTKDNKVLEFLEQHRGKRVFTVSW